MNDDYLEMYLPEFLQLDIDAMVEGEKNNNWLRMDCLVGELKSSINIAFVEGMIDEKQANYLRKKYIYNNKKLVIDE